MLLPCDRPCKQTNRHTLLQGTVSPPSNRPPAHIAKQISQNVARDCHVQCAPTARGQSSSSSAPQRDARKKNTKRILTDTRSSRSQCISHTNANISYEKIKLTNRIHPSSLHSPTCAILTNVTCARTTSTTSLCAFILRHEPCGNAILDCPARINLEYV